MILRLERIRDVLKQGDIEGLIEIGAPQDEYDSEAQMIWQEMMSFESAALDDKTVVAIVRRVWEDMFELDDQNLGKRTDAFASVAREILGC